MARSRSPFTVAMSGALRSACACRSESQFPTRTPCDLTLFTRQIPAANSGASSPLSDASTASFRMADSRIMIDEEPRPRASSDTRQALTVALVKPGRGASRNQAINSSSAMLYTRRVIGEETFEDERLSDFTYVSRSQQERSWSDNEDICFFLMIRRPPRKDDRS